MRKKAMGQQLSKYSKQILRHLALWGLWEPSQSAASTHGYKEFGFAGDVPPLAATKAVYSSDPSIAKRSASTSGMKNKRPSAERAMMPAGSSSAPCNTSLISMRHSPVTEATNSSTA